MFILSRFPARLLTLILGGLFLVACNLLTSPAESPTLNAVPSDSSAAGDSILGAMTTYTDAVAGFAFDYPVDWHILDSVTGGSVLIATFPISEPGTKETSEGVPADQSKMDFIVLSEGTTLESAANDQRHQEGGTITGDESLTLPNGLKAIRLVVSSSRAGDVPVLLVEINNRILLVAGYGDTSPFDPITNTLRLSA